MNSSLNKLKVTEKYPAYNAEVLYETEDSLFIYWSLKINGEDIAFGTVDNDTDKYNGFIGLSNEEVISENSFEEIYNLYFEKIKPYCIDMIEFRVEEDEIDEIVEDYDYDYDEINE